MLVRQKKRPRPCVGFQIGAARAPKRRITGLAITQTVTLSRNCVLFSSHSPIARPLLHVDGNRKPGQSESERRPWLCQQEVAVTVRVEGALGPGARQLQAAAEITDSQPEPGTVSLPWSNTKFSLHGHGHTEIEGTAD